MKCIYFYLKIHPFQALYGENVYQEFEESEDLNNVLCFLENDSLKFFTRIKNHVFSLPFDPSVQILLYRNDLFEDAFLQRAYYEIKSI